MLRKKIYIPIGLCLVLLLVIGFLSLCSDVPDEPVKIYKAVAVEEPTQPTPAEAPVGDTSQGGHFHADGTWHADPHSQVSDTIPEADIDDDAAFGAEMAAYDAEAAQLDAEYEARAKRMKEKAAYIKQLEAENAEFEALLTWGEDFSRRYMADASEIADFKGFADEDFLEKYPTFEARNDLALRLLKFEDYRQEAVARIEGLSPNVRQRFYQGLEEIGELEGYKRFLQPNIIPERALEFLQVNLNEEAKIGRSSQ